MTITRWAMNPVSPVMHKRHLVWVALTCVPENKNRNVRNIDRSLPRDGLASAATGLRTEGRKSAVLHVHQTVGQQGRKALT